MQDLVDEILSFGHGTPKKNGMIATAHPGLAVLVETEPGRLEPMIYDPVVCLVLQGEKETRIGDRCIRFGAGESLIVSHATPVMAAVTQADAAAPYVAMILSIDLDVARAVYDDAGVPAAPESAALGLEAATTDAGLTDAMARLFRASLSPRELKALAPLYAREAHYRMLEASHGAMLRRLMWRDSAASRVGRAIAAIREDISKPMSVPELAAIAAMSVSAFHDRFKALTSTSPLQFQKELRLIEARRLLGVEGRSVSSAAFAVGYESPTQFSREYSRRFGGPPRADMPRRRVA